MRPVRWLILVAGALALASASDPARAADTRAAYLQEVTAECEAGDAASAADRKKFDAVLTIRPRTVPLMSRLAAHGRLTIDRMAGVAPAPGDESLVAGFIASMRALNALGALEVRYFKAYFREKRSADPSPKRLKRLGKRLFRLENLFVKRVGAYGEAAQALGLPTCTVVLASAL